MIRGSKAVFARELESLLDSPVAWVTACVFILGLHAAFFFLGYPVGALRLPGLWQGSYASLQTLFAWLPLTFVALAPALTMGAWAEERRSGTDELLMTLPVSSLATVLGKFAAAWVLLSALVTAAVLPPAFVVAGMGDLDWGGVWGGLLGAYGLGAACIALALVVSALSAEQLVAFLVGSTLLGLLWSANLFLSVLPPAMAGFTHYASPHTHFLETAARGVLDLRDFVYFALFVGFGLFFNALVVEGRRWR